MGNDPRIRGLIQARMGSKRYPGKMMARMSDGRSVLAHVVDRVREFDPWVLTGDAPENQAIVEECWHLAPRVRVWVGSEEQVVQRFVSFLQEFPCEYFFRVCGDSPWLDPELLREAMRLLGEHPGVDLITNVWPARLYPKGQSVELMRTEAFLGGGWEDWSVEEQEHITQYFYRHAACYKIISFPSPTKVYPSQDMAVDVLGDIERVERLVEEL